jgi:hypothetical protein
VVANRTLWYQIVIVPAQAVVQVNLRRAVVPETAAWRLNTPTTGLGALGPYGLVVVVVTTVVVGEVGLVLVVVVVVGTVVVVVGAATGAGKAGGGLGAAGTTVFDAAEAGPVPAPLVAVTVKL